MSTRYYFISNGFSNGVRRCQQDIISYQMDFVMVFEDVKRYYFISNGFRKNNGVRRCQQDIISYQMDFLMVFGDVNKILFHIKWIL